MDINKNQQVNTFLKGMNTDLSDSLLDSSQYRYAENLRLVTNTDSNSGELRLIDGTSLKAEFDDEIIYLNSIRNYVVVITRQCGGLTEQEIYSPQDEDFLNQDEDSDVQLDELYDDQDSQDDVSVRNLSTNDNWEVHVSCDGGNTWYTVFGPCTEEPLWKPGQNPVICGVLRWESDNNIKLYITDDTEEHGIIPIQIAKKDEWDDPSFEPPTDFMSLSGYQDILLSPALVEMSSISGNLKPAKVQYSYRLFKTGGAVTTLAPLSKTLSILKDNGNGYSYTELSNRAVKITIDVKDVVDLDSIQVFRINYIQNGLAPSIHKICERRIENDQETFTVIDNGQNLEQLGLSEFLSYVSFYIKPKIIESKGDTLFAANLKYAQDDADKDFDGYDARSFSSGNYWRLNAPVTYASGVDRFKWDNANLTWREVVSTDSDYTTFEMTEAPIEFDLQDEAYESTGGSVIEVENADLCHRLFENNNLAYNEAYWHPYYRLLNIVNTNKIGGKGTNIDWELVQETVDINEDGTVTEAINTYKHDETYRFGIVLYNDKGKASSVKWIADIRIPPCPPATITSGGYQMKRCTIKFIIKNLPSKCTGYQIVQCPRTISDRRVLMQGIVGRPYRFQECKNNHFDFTNYICPTGLMTMQDMVADNIVTSNNVTTIGSNGGPQSYVISSYGNWHPWEAKLENNYGLTYKFTGDSIKKAGVNITDTVDQNEGDGGKFKEVMASSAQDVIQFAAPEYAYQSDDVKDILDTYKNQIRLEHAFVYTTKGDTVIRTVYADQNTQSGIASSLVSSNTPSSLTRLSFTSSNQGNNTMSFRYRNGIHSTASIGLTTLITHNYTFLQSDVDTVVDVAEYSDSENIVGVNRWRAEQGKRLKKNVILLYDDIFPEYLSFNYIKPYSNNNQSLIVPKYPNISSSAYPEVPEWNKFANGETIRFADDITPIGSYSFINWSAPLIMTGLDFSKNGGLALALDSDGDTGTNPVSISNSNLNAHLKQQAKFFQPLGTGGKCILFKLDNSLSFGDTLLENTDGERVNQLCLNDIVDGQEVPFTPIHIANLVKNVTPYGGYTKYAIENSTYIGGGYFGTETGTITVDGGDAYLGVFKYNASHIWKDATYITGATKMATVYSVPLESDIDLSTAYGYQYNSSNNKAYYIQDKPASFDGYTQEKETYMYNTAYNQTPNVMTYSPYVYNEVSNFNWDTRIHNSELKTNGETIDSWLTFKAMNFLDVDSRFGEITYMKLFKDRLLYWQDKAFGIVSSNERTALTDTNNNQIILGNGGILQRFDYISTVYGMKPNQFATTQSNHNLYFWDGHEKEILAYGESLVPLATVKGIRNHINKHNEVSKPCMFYDNKNKEVVSSVVTGGAIAYSEQTEAFTSIYTYTPLYHTNVFEDMLSATDHQMYLHNVQQDDVTLFGVDAKPLLLYVVNTEATMPKVFDIQTFGGRFYGGSNVLSQNDNEKHYIKGEHNNSPLSALLFTFSTPLKQSATTDGSAVTNREYDFRLDIPRNKVLQNGQIRSLDVTKEWGNRLRGKTMQCEFKSTSNSSDFSLQYIITKYRMSWS